MRINKHLAGIAIAGVIFAAPLAAQDAIAKPFHVGGSLAYCFDQPHKTTQNRLAYSVEVGFEGQLPGTEFSWRPVLSANFFPGKAASNGLKSSLTNIQLAGDVLLKTPMKGLRTVFGVSLNKWNVSNSGTEVQTVLSGLPGDYTVVQAGRAHAIKEVKGIKVGIRLGLEYDIQDSLAVFAMLQGIELGAGPRELLMTDTSVANGAPNALSKGGQNAAFMQFGAKFRF